MFIQLLVLLLSTVFVLKDEDKDADKFLIAREAAVMRLRPVLMTTLAMALGVAPLLFKSDPSLIPLRQMALTILPGISIGTILTLFIIPCFYTYLF